MQLELIETTKGKMALAGKPTFMTDMRVTPGARRILSHLRKRTSISPMESIITYGDTRLAARIHELRQHGYRIRTDMRQDNSNKRYARYTMEAA